MKKLGKIMIATGLAISLAGCFGGPNQTVGTLAGGAAGGIIGSQIGGGSGRTVATVLGTLGGAALGSSVGRSVDQSNQNYYYHNGKRYYRNR